MKEDDFKNELQEKFSSLKHMVEDVRDIIWDLSNEISIRATEKGIFELPYVKAATDRLGSWWIGVVYNVTDGNAHLCIDAKIPIEDEVLHFSYDDDEEELKKNIAHHPEVAEYISRSRFRIRGLICEAMENYLKRWISDEDEDED